MNEEEKTNDEERTNDMHWHLISPVGRLDDVDMNGCLWQFIERHHIEEMCGEMISDDEWYLFVEAFQDGFANDVSQLAVEYWMNRHTWSDEE